MVMCNLDVHLKRLEDIGDTYIKKCLEIFASELGVLPLNYNDFGFNVKDFNKLDYVRKEIEKAGCIVVVEYPITINAPIKMDSANPSFTYKMDKPRIRLCKIVKEC